MSRVLFDPRSAPAPIAPVRHHFDTGLKKPQRTLIVEGCIALLSGVLRPTNYLAAVIPWGACVRSHTDEKGVLQLVDALSGRTPSIAIATGDGASTTQGMGGFQSKKSIELLVYFASSSKRDGYLGRIAADALSSPSESSGLDASLQADPGINMMMEHAHELLIGQRCGASTSVKQIVADREEELYTSDQVTIWLQTYQVEVRVNVPEFRPVANEIHPVPVALNTSIRHRLATNPAEAHLPAAKTDSVTVDLNNDNLGA